MSFIILGAAAVAWDILDDQQDVLILLPENVILVKYVIQHEK